MKKLIAKTVIKTILIIIAIFVVAFMAFNFAFPQKMADVTEKLGNYSLAVKYSNLRYTYTKKTEDLARCFEDSVLSGDDKNIANYGEKLVGEGSNQAEFRLLCENRDESFAGTGLNYRRYVYVKLSVSLYNLSIKAKDAEVGKEKRDAAFKYAITDNGNTSFEYGNALMVLANKICTVGRAEDKAEMLAVLEEGRGMADLKPVQPANEQEAENLNNVIDKLKSAGK